MRPNADQKHGSVCTVTQSARGPTHGDPPLADFCVFFHFVSRQSSWLHDLHYIFFVLTIRLCFHKPPPINSLLWHHHSDHNHVDWLHLSIVYYISIVSTPTIQKVYLCLQKLRANMANLLFKQEHISWINTQRPCPRAESPPSLTWTSLLFAALPLGHSIQHTLHTRLSKRRMWRNMWVSPLVTNHSRLLLTPVCSLWLCDILPQAAAIFTLF